MAALPLLVSTANDCFTFVYTNLDIAYGPCLLHIWNGSCSYQTAQLTTDYHGLYRPIPYNGMYDIRFNWVGNLQHIYTVTVFRRTPTVWQGYDYDLRRIQMTLIRVQEWDPARRVWYEVPVPVDELDEEPLALGDDWEDLF